MMVTINLRLWKGSKKRPKHDTNLSFAVLGSCRWQNDNHLIKLVFQLLVLTRDKTKMVPVCSWSQILLSCCSATPRYSQQLSSWSCIVAWILSVAFQWLVCNRVILGLWTDFCRNHCSVSVAKHFSWNRPRSHHSSELTRQGDSIYSWVQAVSCLCVSVPGCRKEREALWWAGTHDRVGLGCQEALSCEVGSIGAPRVRPSLRWWAVRSEPWEARTGYLWRVMQVEGRGAWSASIFEVTRETYDLSRPDTESVHLCTCMLTIIFLCEK